MKKIHSIFALILLLFASNAFADTSSLIASADTTSLTVTIGGTKLTIPSPEGYHEVSELSPKVRNVAKQMTSETNRLLGIFVSESVLGQIMKGTPPTLNRYMIIQSYKKLKTKKLSIHEFDQLSAKIKKQHKSMLSNVKDNLIAQLDRTSNTLSKEYQTNLNLKVKKQIPLGVYLDKPNVLGFALLNKYRAETGSNSENFIVTDGFNLIRAKNKLLYIYVYSTFTGQEDIDWVRKMSQTWTNTIITACPSSNGSSLLSDWEKVLDKTLVGVGLGGFFALILIIFRWFRRDK